MKIKSLLTAMALSFAASVSAQTYQDVVFLKNGSEIRGIIMEQIPNESLKIKTGDGSLFVFKIDEVSKIAKEEVKARRESREKATKEKTFSRFHRTTGYVGKVETALGFGPEDYWTTNIYTTHGGRFGSRVFLGGGTGFEYIGDGIAFVPIYSNVRFDFSDTRFSPYIDIRLGVGFGDEVGAYGAIGTGLRIAFSPKTAMSLGLFTDGVLGLEGMGGLSVGFEF